MTQTDRNIIDLTDFDVEEVDNIVFRFGDEMVDGEVISTASIECRSIGLLADPTPGDRVADAHQIQAGDVVQPFHASLANAQYVVRAKAELNSGRTLVSAARIRVIKL